MLKVFAIVFGIIFQSSPLIEPIMRESSFISSSRHDESVAQPKHHYKDTHLFPVLCWYPAGSTLALKCCSFPFLSFKKSIEVHRQRNADILLMPCNVKTFPKLARYFLRGLPKFNNEHPFSLMHVLILTDLKKPKNNCFSIMVYHDFFLPSSFKQTKSRPTIRFIKKYCDSGKIKLPYMSTNQVSC